MDYVALSQAIQDYTDNQEATFLDMIPTFIQQAEERIYRSVMIPELRKSSTDTLTLGDQYLARPSDFIAMFSFAVISGGLYSYLLDKDVSFVREAYPSASTRGLPKYYAEFDGDTDTGTGRFIFGPTPDSAYSVELQYYYNPPSIVTTNTSWLGDNAAAALLYGSLVEAYTFMKGDADLLGQYTKRYTEAMSMVFGLGQRLRQDEYRTGLKG